MWENLEGALKRRISRRRALSTAGKVAVGAVVAGVVAGVGGYFAGSATAPRVTITKTAAAETVTVTKTVTVTQRPAAPPEKTSLRITYGSPWKEFIEPAIQDFMRARPEVEIVAEEIPKDLDKKVTIDLAAGVAADIVMVDSYLLQEYVAAGYLLSLDRYMDEWPDWQEFYPAMREMSSVDGTPYVVPIDTDVRFVWYWKENMRKAGIDLPWEAKTWDDLLDAAEKLKQAGVECPFMVQVGSGWGEGSTMQGFYMFLLGATDPVMGPQNRLYDKKTGKWIGKSPAILETFKVIETILRNGYLPREYTIGEVWAFHRERTRKGFVGLNLGGSWEWAEFWPAEERPPAEKRWELLGFTPMPGKNGGKVTISGGWTLGINAKTKNPDLAFEFFKTLFDRDRHAKWLASAGKLAPRKDALEVPDYSEDEYLAEVTKYLEFTTFRDVYPGYPKVSQINQEALDKLIAGEVDAEGAMEYYYQRLVDEFGSEKVEVLE